MKNSACGIIFALWIVECIDAKKYCWNFEGGYPIFFICRSNEECCGTRCCVRTLSVQRLWYFWLLLILGLLFCCGFGFFIRRRIYPSAITEEPSLNMSFTRHPGAPPAPPPTTQQYGDPGGVMSPHVPAYSPQLTRATIMPQYPPPPSYCNHPPPSYEQVIQDSKKK